MRRPLLVAAASAEAAERAAAGPKATAAIAIETAAEFLRSLAVAVAQAVAVGRAATAAAAAEQHHHDDDDDSQEFWREYLLYHRTEGFAFIVDAQDGWSWTAPITGVPEAVGNGVRHEGALYRKLYDYTGKVTYVLGEFYWQLTRHQLTHNSDYQGTGAAAAVGASRNAFSTASAVSVSPADQTISRVSPLSVRSRFRRFCAAAPVPW